MSKRVARLGVFVALAMVFGYIEVLIPFSIGIPGAKLGIANIVVLVAVYMLKPKEAVLIAVVRIVLSGMLFGNGVSLLYSLAGGLLSLFVMLLLKKTGLFSTVGVSVAGGVSHNAGQLLAAACVMRNRNVLYYIPVLLLAGIITGVLIGVVSKRMIDVLRRQN